MNRIEEFGRRIGREFGAERVILFGSYARGAVTDDSDVDLLVIVPFEGRNVDKSGMVQISQIPGNIDLWLHSAWQPQIRRIWGWLHRFWSFAIPKLRLRLPPRIEPCHKSVEIRMKLRPRFPVDLLVRTPEKVRQRIEMGDGFMREIVEEGKMLYEADNR